MQDTMMEYRIDRAAGSAAPGAPQLQRIKALTSDLKHLLERNNNVFDDESISRQIAVLERWMDSYCHDLVAADTFCETSAFLLADLHDRLKLAAEELQRLEGEGGNPASKEQAEKTEQLLAAVRRIETLAPDAACIKNQ